MKSYKLTIIMFLCVVLGSIIICWITEDNEPNLGILQGEGAEEYNKAKNSFKKDMISLNDYVKSIYKSNVTEDSINLTLDELIKNGGDCRNYAFLYKDLAEDMGYNATTLRIKVNKTLAHRIAIVSSEKGYAIMDQKRMTLFTYKNH